VFALTHLFGYYFENLELFIAPTNKALEEYIEITLTFHMSILMSCKHNSFLLDETLHSCSMRPEHVYACLG